MILKEFNLSQTQLNQFEEYYRFLVSENEKYNLTSIVDKEEVYIKHFYDSLKIKDFYDLDDIKTFCDIGSGAGFPAIPIKIAYPNLSITIIEPTLKRCNFLKEVVKLLDLSNVTIINDRSENIKDEYRNYFDIVTARAVASLPILLELTTPYVKKHGHFFALKGVSYNEELELAKNAIIKLNCKVNDIYHYNLPNNLGSRVIIDFLKIENTNPKYPRSFAAIKKNHL